MRNKIYAQCGDIEIKDKYKQVDPVIKHIVGAYGMINNNEDISKGRANWTLCRVIGIKNQMRLSSGNIMMERKYTQWMLEMWSLLNLNIFPKKIRASISWKPDWNAVRTIAMRSFELWNLKSNEKYWNQIE